MASEDSTTLNGTSVVNGGSKLTAAQLLMQKHAHDETHQTTIDDVPDEDDLRHSEEPASGILEAPGDGPAPGWVASMSTKAAGKQPEQAPAKESHKPFVDLQSEESFPGLGGAPTKQPSANVGSAWSAKSAATNGTNGVSTNGTSTPKAGLNTPVSAASQPATSAPRHIDIPGQFKHRYPLKTNEMLPRTQLKKPLPEILKDINKKSKATVTFSPGQDGIVFTGSGPQDAVLKALRDVVAAVGAKVCNLESNHVIKANPS
jgi:hypothetical protein